MPKLILQEASQVSEVAETLFQTIQKRILSALPEAEVFHVGSTSIPDLLTKGDLDVQVRLAEANYQRAHQLFSSWWELNLGGFTEGGASFKDDSLEPDLGVHLTIKNGPADIQWRFTEVLKRREDMRREYSQLKRACEGEEIHSDNYLSAKDRFFAKLEQLPEYPKEGLA